MIIDDGDGNEQAMEHDDKETYILLLLSDSNLPTGSFVASSGLESFVKHGFFSSHSSASDSTLSFIQDSLATYARSALPFVSDAHHIVEEFSQSDDTDIDTTIVGLNALDDLYESMTLNHVAKRASKSQGVALLTLYSKGFSKPIFLQQEETTESTRETRLLSLVDRLKLTIRREETEGHLPICWGVLTGALQLSLGIFIFYYPLVPGLDNLTACAERAQYLHLFLHARGLLSAAVRLNILGPYGAQQLLLHAVRPLIDREVSRCKHLHTELHNAELAEENFDGPATTWPLGEILATRHDLQHSRIFNS